jgi:hypothetical protein
MSGRHKFSELEAKMPPARQARIARLAAKLDKNVGLAELPMNSLSDDDLIAAAEKAACLAIEDYENISKSDHFPMPEYWITCRVAADLAGKGVIVECETRIDGLIADEDGRQGHTSSEKVDIVLFDTEDDRTNRKIRALIEIKSALSTYASFPADFARLKILAEALRVENLTEQKTVLIGLLYGTAPMSRQSLDAENHKIQKLVGYPIRCYGRRRATRRNSEDNWWEIMSIFQEA